MVATSAELDKAINDFAERLEKGIRIEAILLFGSYAQGTAHDDSDIDLAVISPDFEGMAINERQAIIAKLTAHRIADLSPLGYPSSAYHNPGQHSFLREIIRTGRVIYPRPEAA